MTERVAPGHPATGQPGPLRARHDLAHGGRWTSLATAGREWLWQHRDERVRAARAHVHPGDVFVDAGGGEECLPTIQGVPDHGDVWSRPWSPDGPGASVSCPGFDLRREVSDVGERVESRYTVTGTPGAGFLHAVHLLLQVSEEARLELAGTPSLAVAGADGTHRWPWLDGVDQSRFGPVDGTAACLVLPGVDRCRVVDGDDALELSWARHRGTGPGPGLLVWRNLGGWPDEGPYRSIGIEPMLGAGVNHGEPEATSRTDADGIAAWTLTATAS